MPPISSVVIPVGRSIFNAKTFVPPPDKFSTSFRHSDDEEGDHEERNDNTDGEDYAGKGTYY